MAVKTVEFSYIVWIGWEQCENTQEIDIDEKDYNALVEYIREAFNDGTVSDSDVQNFFFGDYDLDDFIRDVGMDKLSQQEWPYFDEGIKKRLDAAIKEHEAHLMAEDRWIPIEKAREEVAGWGDLFYSLPDSLAEAAFERQKELYADEIEQAKNSSEVIEGDVLVRVKEDTEGVYTIPEGVRVIGANAFELCDVEEVILPSTLVKIGKDAFNYSNLKRIEFNAGLKELCDRALCNSKVEHFDVPATIEKIGWCALCSDKLKSIRFHRDMDFLSAIASRTYWMEEIVVPVGCKDKLIEAIKADGPEDFDFSKIREED